MPDPIDELLEYCDKTMSTRRATHVDALVAALDAPPIEGDEVRTKIYRALCYVDDDRARDALIEGLQQESDDAIGPIVEGIWKQQYLLLHRLPKLLLEHHGEDDRFADRLAATLKRHRVTEKIGTDWLADAPAGLEERVTPEPLWA